MFWKKAQQIRDLERLVRVRTGERDEALEDLRATRYEARRAAEFIDEQQATPAAAAAESAVEHSELWSLIDWSLWGSGMGDTFRETLADQFIAAITPEQHQQALELIRWWTEDRGREPLGRRRYEDQQRRLKRALRACARYRTAAVVDRKCFDELAARYWDALGYGPDTLAALDPSYRTEDAK
ncbi:hypothetical protein ACFXD5_06805 [Streptomyces sp. NPDC059385]|uniref:hypothetical protein n=1 Tax=Streptomyces sp. NPDC059385 TaxID=3346817 RepID=UPI003696E5EC